MKRFICLLTHTQLFKVVIVILVYIFIMLVNDSISEGKFHETLRILFGKILVVWNILTVSLLNRVMIFL